MATRIYTKTGDKGTTSLIGGTKVPKSHLRIEAYGTVDELNSFIGLLRDQLAQAGKAASILASLQGHPSSGGHTSSGERLPPAGSVPPPGTTKPPTGENPASGLETISAGLLEIQDRLFTIGSSLACDPEKEPKLMIPDLKEDDITALEKSIDQMDNVLPAMKSFVLPGGHIAVSTTHVVRCVCRRAERCCVRMQEEGLFVEPLVIRYLNRLSDYFFETARYTAHQLKVEELPWKPRTS
ncbi:MAG TPA: ATP:cob(I)alamin adenosyltransferase [Puia sp.]|nr:ATP:cob(I)alamin adenosyltransferase [Puia sp.]